LPGLFGVINIGLSALFAHRDALSVRAQNIANADTPGYHRQEVILGPTPPVPPAGTAEEIIGGQFGTGVNVVDVYRAQESFLSIQARTCQGSLGRFRSSAEVLRQVESVLSPGPGEDISAALDKFWDAWESVANKPENLGLRYVLRDAGVALAETFRDEVARINSIRLTLDDGIGARVTDVNTIAAQVAEYSRQISVAQAEGRSPNDLLDSRDVLLDKLATLTGSMPVSSEGGLLIVYLDGRPLVQGATAYPLSIGTGAGGVEIRSGYDGATVNVQKGEIGGLVYGRDVAIPKYLGEMNALASSLVAEVNTLHQSGFGLDGATARDFFSAGSTAGDIAVDPAVLADVRAIAAGETDAPGDGVIGLQIANLRTTPVINNRSLDEYAQALLGMVGTDVQTSEDGAKTQQSALDQIQQLEQSVSGVSIDEELTYLTLSQRAYEAAARVVSAADEMIKTIIEQFGVS